MLLRLDAALSKLNGGGLSAESDPWMEPTVLGEAALRSEKDRVVLAAELLLVGAR